MKNNFWNLIAGIKNGLLAKNRTVTVQRKKKSTKVLTVLWEKGYILGFKNHEYKTTVFLKYKPSGVPTINSIQKISSQRKKIYYSLNQIWKVRPNQSLIILTTNKGVLSLEDCKKLGVGGEVIIVVN